MRAVLLIRHGDLAQALHESLAIEQSGDRVVHDLMHQTLIALVEQRMFRTFDQRDVEILARFGEFPVNLPGKLDQGEIGLVGGRTVGKGAAKRRLADPDELHRHPAAVDAEVPPVSHPQAVRQLAMRGRIVPLAFQGGQPARRHQHHRRPRPGAGGLIGQPVAQFVHERGQQIGVDIHCRQGAFDLALQCLRRLGASRHLRIGAEPGEQAIQHRQTAVPCLALRPLAHLEQDQILTPARIQQAQQHAGHLASGQSLFQCRVDPGTRGTDALPAFAGLLQARHARAADLQDRQQHLFQAVANHLENAGVVVGPAADTIHHQVEEALQLGIEKLALVIRRDGKLFDEVEHLPGRMVGGIGKVGVLQRQLEQRTFQPFHQQIHVRTGQEVRPGAGEQVRGGIQYLLVRRCKTPGSARRRGDSRMNLFAQ